ncbi:MAG: YjjG family noncanonical pyrimidine nucleotidase [Clostridia bacterium]|nr:YjjG family noncanonical pyrimidine nucleotidase [Clostridia bacterium]
MYKYILWDIDGTVLDFHAAERNAIKTLFEKFNMGECTEEMLRMYSEINAKYWQMLEKGEMSKPEILIGRFREFFENIGADTSLCEDFNKAYQLALGDTIEFVENAKETLLSQKEKYTIAAVTNGTRVAQDKKLRASGLDEIFDAIFISENVGYEKPNKEFFDYVFESLNIKDKSEAIIIGDSLTGDIKGGYMAGIDTCWYNPDYKPNTLDIPITYEIDNVGKFTENLINSHK